MRTTSVARLLVVSALTLCIAAHALADVVTDWNTTLLAAVRTGGTPPPRASRAMAMTHVAIYDAVNGVTPTHQPYAVAPAAPVGVSAEAAAAASAHDVLCSLFPAQVPAFDAALATSLAAIPDGAGKTDGVAWGQSVGAAILALRAADGSTAVVPYTVDPTPGRWQPTPPVFVPSPLLPQWGSVTPFAMTSGDQFRPDGQPSLTGSKYVAELNQTKKLGAADSTYRTAEETTIALFWADGAGTVTPPGHWNQIAQDIAAAEDNSLEENARLFALLNIAMADAAINSWDSKYVFDYWRPVTAIRLADTDGNPGTKADPTWTPLLVTPPFPEYTSGHSTFSASGAAVLAAFYGTDHVAFSTQSDGVPGETRTFKKFSDAAAEAGLSRIYGGIHFMSANREGQAAGRAIGDWVTDTLLLPLP